MVSIMGRDDPWFRGMLRDWPVSSSVEERQGARLETDEPWTIITYRPVSRGRTQMVKVA